MKVYVVFKDYGLVDVWTGNPKELVRIYDSEKKAKEYCDSSLSFEEPGVYFYEEWDVN